VRIATASALELQGPAAGDLVLRGLKIALPSRPPRQPLRAWITAHGRGTRL